MTCNNNSNFNVNQKIIILPEGCSEKDVISLQCKAPDEAIFYQFSLGNRLSSSDTIIDVCAGSTYEAVIVDYISFTGKTFKCRISGGELNTKAGIVFKVITKQGEQREFNVTLHIAPAGIMGTGPIGSYVIGNTGPQGKQGPKGDAGVAATIKIGTVTTGSGETNASVSNSGTENDTILDFIIPKGMDGVGYVNDGTVDLNVKSINGNAKVGTDAVSYATIENIADTTNLARSYVLPNRPIEIVMHKGGVTSVTENTVMNARASYQADQNISFEFDIQSTATDGKFNLAQ